jgi:AcrR family transcriptional regulator
VARTQALEYDQRRERIVEKAARLFARDGFLGASISELADACKISKSAIYHYYPSKEDILFDVMHSHVVALQETAQKAIAAQANSDARLRNVTHAFLSLYAGAADRHKVLLNELDRLPKARRAQIVGIQRGLIDIVEALLCDIQPKLAHAEGASRAAAMLFFGMINWTHTWFNPKGPVSADALADMAVDVALGGFRERK